MYLAEIKVIDTEDVTFIIENDFMAPGQLGRWEYVSVGLYRKTKQGQMKFTYRKRVISVDLVSSCYQG